MGTKAKAIETRYGGCRFRSRLEARYAVFFDALGLKWEYEKEGYELPHGRYLPDFWLPSLRCWIEIKPTSPSKHEENLMTDLVGQTGRNGFIFFGEVPGYYENNREQSDSAHAFFVINDDGQEDVASDEFYAFCICKDCGMVGIEFDGRSDRLPCKECYWCALYRAGSRSMVADGHKGECPRTGKCPRHGGNNDRGHTHDHPLILAAIESARSARFEFGERGPVFDFPTALPCPLVVVPKQNSADRFEEFWSAYPSRHGRKTGKSAALLLFGRLSPEAADLVIRAARNYADYCIQTETYARDPVKFLSARNGDPFWVEWVDAANHSEGF